MKSIKELIEETASEVAALGNEIEEKKQRLKFLKSKVRKLEKEKERHDKAVSEAQNMEI